MTGRLNAIDLPEDVALFALRVLHVSDQEHAGIANAHVHRLIDVYDRLDTDPFPFDDDDLPRNTATLTGVLSTLEQGYQIDVGPEGRIRVSQPGVATLEHLINDVDIPRLDALIDAVTDAYGIDHFDAVTAPEGDDDFTPDPDEVEAATYRLRERLKERGSDA